MNARSLSRCLAVAAIDGAGRDGWLGESAIGFSSDSSSPAPQELFSRAVEAVLALRRAAAYEIPILSAPTEFASFPKSRLSIVGEQISRLTSSAQGHTAVAYAGVFTTYLDRAMAAAGANTTFTRAEFEASIE
ncbi:hypothetical protein F1C58_16165 (plasmid) [Glaciihabitans sp. INWT7]|uniref:hypothetical protein n=1 Tax=Glaciihabitans sp. INWT7 TaxID=2596912 RepID=UPI001624625B|nr:hypothetical protein [Glaciihabitans sp. INWT7]QNE48594.1 hypothetical protein F1C58_16165 [Glaciihabitans sp. INWT7]